MSGVVGVLYGVGLGPGAPDLLTLRAARLIERAEVVAYPAPLGGESFARSIAAEHISPAADEIRIDVPMTKARAPAQAAYDAAAEAIAERLRAGRDVVCLCEGDPFFYGSFMYLHARLAGRFETRVVPGVTSLTACAAAWGAPLIARDEPLTVIPGTWDEAEVEARLRLGGAAAILKVGRRLARLRALIERLGLAERAAYVARASLAQEVVTPLRDAPEDAPYFSMILIRGEDPYAHR